MEKRTILACKIFVGNIEEENVVAYLDKEAKRLNIGADWVRPDLTILYVPVRREGGPMFEVVTV